MTHSVFSSWRMACVLLLGFFSGLPLALTGGTLQAWMASEGVNLKVIGLFAMVGMPYALKFLWAPAMDRWSPQLFGLKMGRRRSWLLLCQGVLGLGVLALGQLTPGEWPWLVAACAFSVSFASASQDIVIDAYRTEILKTDEFGAGSAVAILGYRLAMLTSGAGALILADLIPWSTVYGIMAVLVFLGMVVTVFAPEPTVTASVPRSLTEAVVKPFVDFFSRRGALEILLFVLTYKIGDVLAAALSTPFMLELGFTKTEIGSVNKGFGLIATIVGGLIGGGLMAKLGLKRSLWYFGLVQALSIVAFAVLAEVGPQIGALAAAVAIENLGSGLGNAALVAFIMGLCNRSFTATQYALLTSFTALTRVFVGSGTGYLASELGWTWYFILCTIAAIPALILIQVRFERWQKVTVAAGE